MVDLKQNALDIQQEIDWLKDILKARSAMNSKQAGRFNDVLEIPAPELRESQSAYAQFVKQHGLGAVERFLVILSSVPHIKPELLDMFMAKNSQTHQVYTEFGGRQGKNHNGFIPTGVTVLFILSGCDLKKRFEYSKLFDPENILFKNQILNLGEVDADESFLNGALTISKETLDMITTGKQRRPTFSNEFPAQLLLTKMEWEDLVLPPSTAKQLAEIETWLQYKDRLMGDWGMGRILKPGYKALFYGPPGTGKTLTANLLGKKVGIDVYRIDLSKLVSKYIGETEKNLSKIFDKAEKRNWILFFDEADALFGKRTSVSDAHDRYANQEVSYLLQRIEDYDGLVILASNLKNNLDDAFMRRFQTSIHFPIPRAEERMKIWEKSFPTAAKLEPRINLQDVAKNYELAGGSIINVVQHSSLMALKRGNGTIQLEDITEGVRREYYKAGRTM